VQPKYDGHRCMITRRNGDMFAYSRKGKSIDTIGHIFEDAYQWMQDGDTIDGELYIHGQSLQAISSLIKRDQPGSRALTFRWYDMDLPRPYAQRYRTIRDLYANVRDTAHIGLAPTGTVTSMSQVWSFFRKCREKGYEGCMLRRSIAGYQANKRSNQLLKVKEREDCEVITIGVRPSARGWAILRVRTDWGVEFDVAAPGSVDEKTEVLHNYDAKYHGRKLTVEYACLTADQIPFHCVAMRWHEEV
jgi:DNA ligase 1